MKDPIKFIRDKAKKDIKKIILPETEDIRVLKAALKIAKDKIARILFLGCVEGTKKKLCELGDYDSDMIEIIDPKSSRLFGEMAGRFYEKRRHKNPDRNFYKKLLNENYVYFAALMVDAELADGFVAGADHRTSDVAKAAIYCIGVDDSMGVAAGAFIIYLKGSKYGDNGLFLFADCGLTPDPIPKQLAGISVSTGRLFETLFGKKAYVAMLSYSTRNSARGPLVDKVKNALEEAKKLEPGLIIDGELQADSALEPSISEKKASIKGSPVAGRANVLIFPNLDSGNIGYKLVHRLAGARAIGPLMLGLKKPCSDLSRGCSVDDIIDAVAVTAVRGQT